MENEEPLLRSIYKPEEAMKRNLSFKTLKSQRPKSLNPKDTVMTGRRFNPFQYPPSASSSDEEDEEVEEVEGNSSQEEEVEEEDDVSSRNPTVKKPETEKKQISDSESGSEPGSDEETDSEPEFERKDPVKKNYEPFVVKNQGSKKVESSVTKKRSSETDASTDAKRAKTVSGEETKNNYFQRVWSEEDEIALLQGIIDYNMDTGANPYDDKNVFYELVKKSLSFDVSKAQFMEKIRGLKKKFENNLGKGKKKNSEDPAFSKPHDRKAFDLSKLLWGDYGVMAIESSNGKSSKKSKNIESKKQEELVYSTPKVVSVVKKQEVVSIVDSVARFGVDELAAKQGWARLSAEDKKRFEEQWKVLQIGEFKFYSQKSGFIHEVVTKMTEAFRPNP